MVHLQGLEDQAQPNFSSQLLPTDLVQRSRSSDSTSSVTSTTSVSSTQSQQSTSSEGLPSSHDGKTKKKNKKSSKKKAGKNILMTNTLLSYMSVGS